MNVWFSSDLHIRHRLVAALRAGYDSVPDWWSECETRRHDEILADTWDGIVKPGDQVWVLGDISSGTNKAQLNALEWIKKRPGVKHLISGNHDSCHPLHRDSHKWQKVYLGGAFESVQMAAKRRIPGLGGHVTAMLSHFPYRADRGDETRYPEWRLKDCGYHLLHGHTHSAEKFIPGQLRTSGDGYNWAHGPQIHVGVDAWDGRPVHLDEISEIVSREG